MGKVTQPSQMFEPVSDLKLTVFAMPNRYMGTGLILYGTSCTNYCASIDGRLD